MKGIIKYGAIALFSLLTYMPVNAQSVDVVIKENGKERTENIDLPKSMTYPIDSLLKDWQSKTYVDLGKDCNTSDENPYFSDSVYIDRLSRMPTVMEMPYNSIIRKFIDMYCTRLRSQVSFMLSASNLYMPIFEEALDAYNLPFELKYLPIIESSLNPSATSRVGAAGLWQFMLSTGKVYGLEINSYVDERRDPIKASWVAARYLKDLYNIYGDWNLVIAAYNCGPGSINKAIRRAGGVHDYWKIYNYLPKETRGYVPAFIAANYVMTYYCKHNICPMETNIPENTDTIQVNKNLHLEQVAALCDISLNQLRSLNPQYKRNIVPGDTHPYTLRLPQDRISTFIDQKDSIYAYHADELFTNRHTVEIDDTPSSSYARESRSYSRSYRSSSRHSSSRHDRKKKKKGSKNYTIKNGDTLSEIADKYNVSVKQLKKWNKLHNGTIRKGKRLKIHK